MYKPLKLASFFRHDEATQSCVQEIETHFVFLHNTSVFKMYDFNH